MSRRLRHTPRIRKDRPERRKTLFDRRQHGGLVRFLYAMTLLPLGRFLHAVSGGRIPIRADGE